MVISTSSLVGMHVDPVVHDVDERWTMAYAAALDDHLPAYLDTTTGLGLVAHPLFGVCPEWPAIIASRERSIELGVTPAEVLTSVHATHDATIHRLIRPGDQLSTSIELVGLEQISPGAKSTTRLTTVDADGKPVTTSTQAGIYLGQAADGPDRADPTPPQPLHAERQGEPTTHRVVVHAGAAHTYTECARIWNPIHTNKAVAIAAGLPDIILHGTANLAHGVSHVIARHANDQPELVRRITCRFAAMVQLPSIMTVQIWDAVGVAGGSSDQRAVPFEVLNEQGEPAVKEGVVLIGDL